MEKDKAENRSQIRQFWDGRATEQAPENSVTHSDVHQRTLEIARIQSFLKSQDRLLDLGCGNGFSTRVFSSLVKEVVGIDFSDEMIVKARQLSTNYDNISFKIGDMRTLSQEVVGKFDCVVSERALINLENWNEQQQTILNIHKILNDNGRYIMCEGSADGRAQLNQLRVNHGLNEMPKVWHNLDFEEARTLRFLEEHFNVVEQISFGIYDLVARVVHPLLVAPEEPQYLAEINKIASSLSQSVNSLPEYSRILFLVLEKKKIV